MQYSALYCEKLITISISKRKNGIFILKYFPEILADRIYKYVLLIIATDERCIFVIGA
jgi:hypothetical protein